MNDRENRTSNSNKGSNGTKFSEHCKYMMNLSLVEKHSNQVEIKFNANVVD